jgi:PhnB protein
VTRSNAAEQTHTPDKERTMEVQPYLIFDRRCEEALEFYKKAIGAEVVRVMRNKDNPEPAPPGTLPPGSENKIMHSTFRVGETTIMASDGYAKGNPRFECFSLSLSAANEAEADRLLKALSEGGQVRVPLAKTFFAKKFGMLADKFGVGWIVITAM